jgi:adenosylcobyric acid synthase
MDSCRSDCFCRIQDHRTGIESPDGAAAGNIYGTYVHGVFDGPGIARMIVEILAEHKGLTLKNASDNSTLSAPETDNQAYKETQYDLLAETLRRHLDMKRIYEILEES